MLKIIVIAFIAFISVGCTVASPHISEFRINPIVEKSEILALKCNAKSIKVAKAFSSNSLMSQNMNYGVGDYKRGLFTQSQWASSPNREITSQIVKTLQDSKLFESVQVSNSRSVSSLILETNIEEFMQYFSKDKKSSLAKVVISNTLIDANTNVPLHTKTFTQIVKADTLDAEGGVVALNKALSLVLTSQRDWLGEICK